MAALLAGLRALDLSGSNRKLSAAGCRQSGSSLDIIAMNVRHSADRRSRADYHRDDGAASYADWS